ncbi:MAG: EAL domain-containing protein [Acidobacteriota bacterium]
MNILTRMDELSRTDGQPADEVIRRAIARANAEWERTFDSVPDLIAIMDLNYRIVKMNRAMLTKLGLSPHGALGMPCHSCVHSTSGPIHSCPYGELLEDGCEHSLEIYEERLDGYFLVTVTPLHDMDGKLSGAIHIARDITSRKRMEDELRRAHDELEKRVRERTAELAVANVKLQREVEERIKAEEAVRRSERFLQSSLNALAAHIAILDEHGTVIAVNEAWKRYGEKNGYAEDCLGIGRNYIRICEEATGEHCEEAPAVARGIRKVIGLRAGSFHTEYYCPGPERKRWFIVRATRFAGEGPVRVVVAHEDITDRKMAEEQLLYDAFHDSLTGLPNRALFLDRLRHALKQAQARTGHHLAVLFLDFDHFKVVNDSLGHKAGDLLLTEISRRLESCLRSTDTVARLGGDEFAVLLEEIGHASDAIRFAEKVHETLAFPFLLEGREIFTTVSIGIALGGGGAAEPEEILRDADTALFRAKSLGRSRHEIFDKEMHHRAVKRLQMETDLRRAVERNQFLLHYQPIVSLKTGRISGFEALIRWLHPERGLVSPIEFIPLAEETGLIVPMGAWVLREACRTMRGWQLAYPTQAPLVISVNLSGRQLAQSDIIDQVRQVLAEIGINPSTLKLEITESMLMENTAATVATLSSLKELGVQLSLDDFGTGYSSLSYLHRFPIDVLKIDRSFVGNMFTSSENASVVRTIIALAHNLGLEVIAEGPETADQVVRLRALGCEYGQGYYFSRPVEAGAAGALIASERRFFES